MNTNPSINYLTSLLRELLKLPKEMEWVEFKQNRAVPVEIGEYISALSNSAALNGKTHAYMIWGIEDTTHVIKGTTFSPAERKKGNEELENWLLRLLTPRIPMQFYKFEVQNKQVVMLEVGRAFRHPVQFQGVEFIRIGSYKKKLKDFPEKEREIWRIFDQTPFEQMVAAKDLPSEGVLRLLDYSTYFELLGQPIPESHESVLQYLESDELIVSSGGGSWNITNLGAILFSKRLVDFRSLRRKVVRVVVYKGNSRIETEREQEGVKGYATGFEGLVSFINALLPYNEVIEKAIRRTVPVYPEIAIRELIANALIHQDFLVTGSGPMVEIFENRMEVTNPGAPLVDTKRFLDSPPKSRNEALASFLRRIGICEERGSGIDKVVFQTEVFQLPPPVFEKAGDGSTRAVLFSPQSLTQMDKEDRIRACYLHACLKYVNHDFLTNTSIRQRFGIKDKNKAMASRYIREAMEVGAIRPYDEGAPPKLRKYIPFWA
jgi:ATP-dependent DNA helicase RecG